MVFIVESGGIGGYVRIRSRATRNLYETGAVLAGGKDVRNGRCLLTEWYMNLSDGEKASVCLTNCALRQEM